jgi:PLP dependent protein
MTDELALFQRARQDVLGRIADACARAGRSPAEVTLVAVSKTVPPERVRSAVEAGFTVLGENRVQEGEEKRPQVPGATWHLIGPLQSNKARRALETFSVIQSVHDADLAGRLNRLCDAGPPYPVLLQVNVDRDPSKAGFDPETILDAVETLDSLDRLEFRGLMTIGHAVARSEDARPTFVALRAVGDRLRGQWPRLGSELSMGMSDDYPIAVEEGATIVRIGRAIFGERPTG